MVDRNLITASGPGQALDFGIAMLRSLVGDEVADSVKAGMLSKLAFRPGPDVFREMQPLVERRRIPAACGTETRLF